MSGTVLATVARSVTLDRIDAIAEQVAVDRASARKAAELGVPAILAALSENLCRASGVARLKQALQMGSTSMGPKREGSGGVIGFLLGDVRAGVFASVIGRFVGAHERSTLAFLDELTAVILSALAEASGEANGDGRALASLLKSEREGIAAAVPSGLASLLGAHGFSQRPGGVALPSSGEGGSAKAAWGARRLGTSRAAGVLVLLAVSSFVAWSLLAPGLEQQTASGARDGVVSALSAPDARRAGPAGMRAEVVAIATEQLQDAEAFNRAQNVTDWLGGAEGQIAAALVRLGRLVGIGAADIALPLADLTFWPDRRRSEVRAAEERRLVEAAHRGRLDASAAASGRQHLRFVSEDFREAILSANEGAAGSLVAK
jgi:hypothetical protein